MRSILFAQDMNAADSDWLAFCRRWGDTASVLGLLLALVGLAITLVGFFLTLRGQRKIREASEAMAKRAAYQIAAAEVGTLLRQVEAVRDAVRHQIWLAAVIRGGEARHVASSLTTNGALTENERSILRDLEEKLRLVVQYIEQRLLPQGHGTGLLATIHRRELDVILRKLSVLRGRLQNPFAGV